MGKMVVILSPSSTGIEKTLSGSRLFLRGSRPCRPLLEDRRLDMPGGWGWAKLQLAPVHPGAAIESSLQLHAGAAHGAPNLLALDPASHTLPANRVILAYRTALPNAQHGIQIRFRQHRTVGIARQLRLATKAPVPERHKHLLEIRVRRRQVLRTHLSQPLHQFLVRCAATSLPPAVARFSKSQPTGSPLTALDRRQRCAG